MPGLTPYDPILLGCLTIDTANLYGCYFHIVEAFSPGPMYVSCLTDGSRVDLWGEDDNSGRQRWEILPNGAAAPVGVTPFSFYIRVLCGVTGDQQYFGVDTDPDPGFPNGRIQLVTKNLAASWVLYKDPDEAHYDIVLYKEKGVQLRVLPTNNVLGLKPFDPSVAVPFWQVAKVSR